MKKLSIKNIRLSTGGIRAIILIALSCIIVILTSVYFVKAAKASSNNPSEIIPKPEIPYLYTALPRAASITLTPQLNMENIIDGEEKTSICTILPAAREYIFGDSLATKRDFLRDSTNQISYMARMTANGTMQTVTLLGNAGHNTFVSAKNTGLGFAVLINSDTGSGDCMLYHLDYEGRLINTLELGTPRNEKGVDLYFYNNILTVVIEVTDTTGRKELCVQMFDPTLSEIHPPKRIYGVMSLEYSTIFRLPSNYTIFATATEAKSVYPIIIKFTEDSTDFTVTKLNTKIPRTRLTHVIPAAGGYLMGIISLDAENKAKLVHYGSETITDIFEGSTDAVSVKIIDGDEYYFRVECDFDGITTYSTASVSKDLKLLSGNVTKLSGGRKLLNVIKSEENYYALVDNGGKTEVTGLNSSYSLKVNAAPVNIRIDNGNMITYGHKDNKPYISFSDCLFLSTPF